MTTIFVNELTTGAWLAIHAALAAGHIVRVHVRNAAPFLVRRKP
jgi:hypothetical protein